MAITSLFPTQIYRSTLNDKTLLKDLEASIWALEAGDQAGHTWCTREGYDGYTSYASLDDLPERDPAFGALAKRLDTHAGKFAKALFWDLGNECLVLDSLWVNILGEGGTHSGHIHPSSVLSGTLYVTMPKGAGALRLEDPRLPFMMAAPAPQPDAPDTARRFMYLTPPAGTILIWESWLRHEVVAHRSATPRLSISFNYALAPRGAVDGQLSK